MKTLACLLAVAITSFALVSDARAAEPNGNVDQATLASMGLSGLNVMSDEEGKNVRGTFAIAFGFGSSSFLGQTQFGGYAARDTGRGPDFAAGGNNNQTGVSYSITNYGRNGRVLNGQTFVGGAYAVGSSWAYAGR